MFSRKKSDKKPMRLKDLGIEGKIFCISMQRSGTTSVGNFLEQWLKHANQPLARDRRWARAWYDGNFEAIFSDPVFKDHEVFEDSPFWYPDFYKFIYHRVPNSKFILLDRDADGWFKSMVRHSKGFSLGRADIHAKIYRREEDLKWLEENIPGYENGPAQAMTIFDQSVHYKSTYLRHTHEAKSFFQKNNPDALFYAKLTDKDVWTNLANWLGLNIDETKALHSHSHKASGELTRDHLLK
jgi:hypothetical protein